MDCRRTIRLRTTLTKRQQSQSGVLYQIGVRCSRRNTLRTVSRNVWCAQAGHEFLRNLFESTVYNYSDLAANREVRTYGNFPMGRPIYKLHTSRESRASDDFDARPKFKCRELRKITGNLYALNGRASILSYFDHFFVGQKSNPHMLLMNRLMCWNRSRVDLVSSVPSSTMELVIPRNPFD